MPIDNTHTNVMSLAAVVGVLIRRKIIGCFMARNLSTLNMAIVKTLAATVTPANTDTEM